VDVIANKGGLVVSEDHAQDDASGDANEQIVAAVVTDIMVAAGRRTQVIAVVVADDVIAVTIVGRQAVAAAPSPIAVAGVRNVR